MYIYICIWYGFCTQNADWYHQLKSIDWFISPLGSRWRFYRLDQSLMVGFFDVQLRFKNVISGYVAIICHSCKGNIPASGAIPITSTAPSSLRNIHAKSTLDHWPSPAIDLGTSSL